MSYNPSLPPVTVSTLSNVASSITSVQLAAANAGRLGFHLHNDSTAVLYLKFGTTASLTSFTVKISSQTYYEMPFPIYQGRIDGIWDVANGSARLTELT